MVCATSRQSGRLVSSRPLVWLAVVGSMMTMSVTYGADRAAAATTGFVTRSGTSLSLNGAPYRFTGLNIYNANSVNNYWYTLGNGPGLDKALTDAGPGKTVFRAWFGQWLSDPSGHGLDWSAFDHTLAVAKAHNYRVIVTLGDQDGTWDDGISKTLDAGWYQGGYATTVSAATSSWGARNTMTYQGFVEQIVRRYRNDPSVLMWQLMNEAETKRSDGSCSEQDSDAGAVALRGFADTMGADIKRIDPNHLVSLGTIGTGQCGTSGGRFKSVYASPGLDVTEMHDYVAGQDVIGDPYNGMALRLRQSRELGKPMFVGEMGIDPAEVGGLAARADRFRAKLQAQFAAGVVGVVAWEWRNAGQDGGDRYVIGPADPVLTALARADPGSVPAPEAGGWRINGSARVAANGITLTDATTTQSAGCAFWPTPLPSSAIDASFDSVMGGGSGADGLTFVLADPATSLTRCGGAGGGLGWSGTAGVALALDTYRNGSDPSSNFVGVATGAQAGHSDNLVWAATSSVVPALRSGSHHVSIHLSAGTVTLSLDGVTRLTTSVTLASNVLVGFSAGDGGLTDAHSVSNVVIRTSA